MGQRNRRCRRRQRPRRSAALAWAGPPTPAARRRQAVQAGHRLPPAREAVPAASAASPMAELAAAPSPTAVRKAQFGPAISSANAAGGQGGSGAGAMVFGAGAGGVANANSTGTSEGSDSRSSAKRNRRRARRFGALRPGGGGGGEPTLTAWPRRAARGTPGRPRPRPAARAAAQTATPSKAPLGGDGGNATATANASAAGGGTAIAKAVATGGAAAREVSPELRAPRMQRRTPRPQKARWLKRSRPPSDRAERPSPPRRPVCRRERSVDGCRADRQHGDDQRDRAGRRRRSGLRQPWPDRLRLLDRASRQGLRHDADRWREQCRRRPAGAARRGIRDRNSRRQLRLRRRRRERHI